MTAQRQLTKLWSAEDLQKLRTLADVIDVHTKETWAEIGIALGRSLAACKGKYFWERDRAVRKKAPVGPAVQTWRGRDAAMERARMRNARAPEPQSLTAWLCGDPLPGRSALDQKLAAPARPGITLPTAGMSI